MTRAGCHAGVPRTLDSGTALEYRSLTTHTALLVEVEGEWLLYEAVSERRAVAYRPGLRRGHRSVAGAIAFGHVTAGICAPRLSCDLRRLCRGRFVEAMHAQPLRLRHQGERIGGHVFPLAQDVPGQVHTRADADRTRAGATCNPGRLT